MINGAIIEEIDGKKIVNCCQDVREEDGKLTCTVMIEGNVNWLRVEKGVLKI